MATIPVSHPPRDPSADGFRNRVEAYVLTHFPGAWHFIMRWPWLRKGTNRIIVNRAAMRARTRPSPYGSMAIHGESANDVAAYTSWEMMTDRSWFGRHLPPGKLDTPDHPLPAIEELRSLYTVAPGEEVLSEHSTLLFPSFAQWFTDGFLMTDPADTRKTHTSHQIDFSPLYGLTRAESDAIRERSSEYGRKGRLKSETDPVSGEEFAPRYFEADGAVKPEFKALRPPLRLEAFLKSLPAEKAAAVRASIFAFAGERANSTPYTAMLSTLFLREHNRLAGLIERANPGWDDERVFQTARNVNIALLIKIVVEEYINHISPYHFSLSADPSACWHTLWNRPNWIPIEFNLLYRWHSLTPAGFDLGDRTVPLEEFLFANDHLLRMGLGQTMGLASEQRAWRIGLHNTAAALVEVELASVQQGRRHRLASYNDYREAFGYGRVQRFEQITGDPRRIEALRRLYEDVDNIEFFVGLFAEDITPRAAVPPLIGRMVALDAFSQALTNPLLSEHAFNPQTFSVVGMEEIEGTTCLQQILDRNSGDSPGLHKVRMEIASDAK